MQTPVQESTRVETRRRRGSAGWPGWGSLSASPGARNWTFGERRPWFRIFLTSLRLLPVKSPPEFGSRLDGLAGARSIEDHFSTYC